LPPTWDRLQTDDDPAASITMDSLGRRTESLVDSLISTGAGHVAATSGSSQRKRLARSLEHDRLRPNNANMDAATNKRAVAPFDGLVGFYDFDRAPAPAVVAGHDRPSV
jgi:hypothetical protein